ncbi:Gag protein, putative [Candida maltosa Xu316]|uniref:Gag protein, putative n=1 Tax=Candida maltosa (strain Xu316) TaxID=1245528 RepID=M3J023_CANMX|nr:Gag protein, putative [Candida maltosa Xu316]
MSNNRNIEQERTLFQNPKPISGSSFATTGGSMNIDDFQANFINALSAPSFVESLVKVVQQSIQAKSLEAEVEAELDDEEEDAEVAEEEAEEVAEVAAEVVAEVDPINYVAISEEQAKHESVEDVDQFTSGIAAGEDFLKSRKAELEVKTANLKTDEQEVEQFSVFAGRSKQNDTGQIMGAAAHQVGQSAFIVHSDNDLNMNSVIQSTVVDPPQQHHFEIDFNSLIKNRWKGFILDESHAPPISMDIYPRCIRVESELIINGSNDPEKVGKLLKLQRYFMTMDLSFSKWAVNSAKYMGDNLEYLYLQAERNPPNGMYLTWKDVVHIVVISDDFIFDDMDDIDGFDNHHPKPSQKVREISFQAQSRANGFAGSNDKSFFVHGRMDRKIDEYFINIFEATDANLSMDTGTDLISSKIVCQTNGQFSDSNFKVRSLSNNYSPNGNEFKSMIHFHVVENTKSIGDKVAKFIIQDDHNLTFSHLNFAMEKRGEHAVQV